MTQTNSTDDAPKLLRRTVIKLTAAGATLGAAGGAASTSAAAQEAGEAEVVLAGQLTDGRSITVESTTLPNGGFLTLVDPLAGHERDQFWPAVGQDMPTLEETMNVQVLGSTEYLEAGTHEDFEWELDSRLSRDGSRLLQVWAHQDTNESEEFDYLDTLGEEDGWYPSNDPEADSEIPDVVMGDAHIDIVSSETMARFEQLRDDLAALGVENEDLLGQITALEDAHGDLESAVDELESEKETLQGQVDDLEGNNEGLEGQVSDLEGNNEGLEDQVSDLEDENQNLSDRISELEDEQSDSIPGFGVAAAAAGVAGGAAVAAKRMLGQDEDEE